MQRRALTDKPWLISIGLCVIALALRAQVATDAFWLDEIWSYYLSKLMQSPWDAFSELRIDNNHLLNTLLMYWTGEQANWSIYRLPALLSGVATVALMAPSARLIAARPWLAMLLGAISLPLIQYSAEARGYSSAALFGLLSWYIRYAHLQVKLSPVWLLAFWTSCILGMLSHLTFIFVLVALGIALLWDLAADRRDRAMELRRASIIFAVPLIFTTWIYFYFYGRMSAGGETPEWKLLPNLLELSRVTLGAPDNPVISIFGAILLTGLLGYGMYTLQAVQRRFFVLAIFLVPGLMLTVYQPDYFYPRYLLVLLPFVYMILARALSQGLDAGRTAATITGIFIFAIVSGSTVQYSELARLGKGDYPAAVANLYSAAGSAPFTVGSDFDFRNKALLDFYLRYRKDTKQMTYIEKSYESAEPTDFFIMHNLQTTHQPKRVIELKSGRYRLLQQYPHAGLSGWNWYLYQHE